MAAATPMGSLEIDDLLRAIAIYLEIAYPDGQVPAAVRQRIIWPEGTPLEDLLAGRPFERTPNPGGDGQMIHALRLGNAHYPNMKLQVQHWNELPGYMLSVNAHDQVMQQMLNPSDLEGYRALQTENRRIKEAIEAAWKQAQLPTFVDYLEKFLVDNPGTSSADAGEPCT